LPCFLIYAASGGVLNPGYAINTTPEKVFCFLTSLVDDKSYRAWHPDDHVGLRWLMGPPWKVGSIVCAEEYIHGKLHRLKFVVTKVIPNSFIEYMPVSRFMRRFFPKNMFTIERKEKISVFTATGMYRIGWLAKTFAKKRIERGLSSVKKHMREEGENLKRLLEGMEAQKTEK
jgi:hypothetical protein